MSRWIEYVATIHKCRCLRCGQFFYAAVGNIYAPENTPPEPHRIPAKCPSCGLRGKPKHELFVLLGLDKQTAKRSPKVQCYANDECVCGQISIDDMVARLQEANKQLLTIKLSCQHILSSWRNDWASTVMPTQMKRLESLLKELETDD